MRLLIDTHVFLWLMDSLKKVPDAVQAACGNPSNTLYLSIASVWEMQIKIGKGKLVLRQPLPDILAEQQQENGLLILPVGLEHLWALDELPARHGDLFDRMLIAQAMVENMFLVSADQVFSEYPVKLFW